MTTSGTGLGSVLGNRLDTLSGQWSTALTTVENRLTAQIGCETATRSEDNAKMTERIDHITERLAALEGNRQHRVDKEESAPKESKQQDGWRPRHIILGGWPERTPREVVEREAAAWLSAAPQHIQEACLRPFASKEYWEISKVKVTENMVTAIGWRIANILEKRVAGAKPPTWSAVERSAEDGRRRRITTETSERAMKEFEAESNGSIDKQEVEVAKFDGTSDRWIQKPGWCALVVGD